MDDRRALARSFGVDFERLLLGADAVAQHCAFRGNAGEICQALRTAQSLEVFTENLIGRRRPFGLLDNVFGFFWRRAIKRSQIRRNRGLITSAMAGIAGQNLLPTEISLTDRRHHEDHSASGLLIGL